MEKRAQFLHYMYGNGVKSYIYTISPNFASFLNYTCHMYTRFVFHEIQKVNSTKCLHINDRMFFFTPRFVGLKFSYFGN